MFGLSKKTILIIGGVAVFLAIVLIAILASKESNTTPPDTTGTTTGTGGYVSVTPSPADLGRGEFKVVVDPSRPFATITPRSDEPVILSSVPAFDNYQTAIDQGLIPDSNGNYKQVVDPSGYTPLEQKQLADYNMPTMDFINKYYGASTVNDINTGSLGGDDIVIATDSSIAQESLPLIPEIDVTMFVLTPNNNKSTMTKYVTELSDATKRFDLVHDDTITKSIFDAQSTAGLDIYTTQANQVLEAIKQVSVPSALLGLSQLYVKAYQQYLDFTSQVSASLDPATQAASEDSNQIYNTYTALGDTITQIKDSVTEAAKIIKNAPEVQ
ncbi:MAG: hypothetical protein AAB948_04455 [Patescibacteria group bacterium]